MAAIDIAVGGNTTICTGIGEFAGDFAERASCWISNLGTLGISPRRACLVMPQVGNDGASILGRSRSSILLV